VRSGTKQNVRSHKHHSGHCHVFSICHVIWCPLVSLWCPSQECPEATPCFLVLKMLTKMRSFQQRSFFYQFYCDRLPCVGTNCPSALLWTSAHRFYIT